MDLPFKWNDLKLIVLCFVSAIHQNERQTVDLIQFNPFLVTQSWVITATGAMQNFQSLEN